MTHQAHAASIAYIDNGEVWLSSLDGAQKVRLAAPVVNASGAIDKWLDVAASDIKAPGNGLRVKVNVPEAGKVTLTATVPAKAMGRKGKPVRIGTGSATAKGAGTVTVKLKLNAAARKRLKRL